MEKITANSPEAQSADLIAANIARLKALFPELVSEDKNGAAINVDVLKALVGDATVTDADEKYGLNWHGKRAARQLALTPSTGTLTNLEVLKLLQKSYAGKVKLIYIDPPYNTGKDFVYPDNYQDNIKNYLELTGQIEGGQKISSNTESSGRFHTDWLNMMYPRLKLAHLLLKDEGVIFVSIDDSELGNLLEFMNELFGEENFQANISWQKRYTRSNNTVDFTTVIEHLVVYSKKDNFKVNLLERTKEADARYTNPDNDIRGPWKGASMLGPVTPQQRPALCYPIINPNTGQETLPTKNAWRRSKDEFDRLAKENRLYWGIDGKQPIPSIKMFLSEAREITPVNFWDYSYAGNTDDGTRDLSKLVEEKIFDNPKPVQLIQRVLEHATKKDSIVLDFFAGSGTTGHAVMAQNAVDSGSRRYILVQLPELLDPENKDQKTAAEFCDKLGKPRTIAEITKERLRRAGDKLKAENPDWQGDTGFRVFKLDTSNIRAWNPQPENLQDALLDYQNNLLAGRSETDVLYELLLKLGLDLCVPIETRDIANFTVYAVGGGVLLACLAEKISREQAEPLALGIAAWHKELAPAGDSTCVFRDNAFADDAAKTNLSAILEQHGIANVRSL